MMRRVSKIHKDRLGVANVQKPIRLRRKPREYFAMRDREMCVSELGGDLRIFARLVEAR
jgi:hypothetical protein